MTKIYTFDDYLAIGTTLQDPAIQSDFFIRSSALTRAFLMAKEQAGLAIHKSQIIENMFDVIGTYGSAVCDDSKRMFIANLGGYVADLNNPMLTQRYTQLITAKVA